MTDIVERLRAFPPGDGEGGLFHDAADEIERLVKEVKQLEDHWDDIAHERNGLKAENERLRALVDKLSTLGVPGF